MRNNRRGLTLIDLLLALGALLLATAVLLAAINQLRRHARTTACASNLRLLLQATAHYAAQYRNALPGSPWTSGATSHDLASPAPPSPLLSPFDYLSPLTQTLRLTGLPPADASPRVRYLALINHTLLSCPDNTFPALPLGDPTYPIARTPSYTTNTDFLLRSSILFPFSTTPYLSSPSAQLPLFYQPRFSPDLIGNLSRKVFLLESAGQVDPARRRISYHTPTPASPFADAAFTRPRPAARTAYPLLTGNLADASLAPDPNTDNLFLLATARHGTTDLTAPLSAYKLNAGFFDGHVETLSVLEALNPDFNSPRHTLLDLTTTTTAPRIIQHHLQGKQDPAYLVP